MRRQALRGLAALCFALSGCGPLVDVAAAKNPTVAESPASDHAHPQPAKGITPVQPATTIEQPEMNNGEPAGLVTGTPAPLPTSDASPVSAPTTAPTPALSPSPAPSSLAN